MKKLTLVAALLCGMLSSSFAGSEPVLKATDSKVKESQNLTPSKEQETVQVALEGQTCGSFRYCNSSQVICYHDVESLRSQVRVLQKLSCP